MRDDYLALEWMYGEHPEGIRYRPQHERSAIRSNEAVRQHYPQHARKQGGLKGGIAGRTYHMVRPVIEQADQEGKKNEINNHEHGR